MLPPMTTIFPCTLWIESAPVEPADDLLFVYFNGATWEWCNFPRGYGDNILRFHVGLAALVELHRYGIRR